LQDGFTFPPNYNLQINIMYMYDVKINITSGMWGQSTSGVHTIGSELKKKLMWDYCGCTIINIQAEMQLALKIT